MPPVNWKFSLKKVLLKIYQELVKHQKELEKLQDRERKLQEDLQESTVDLEKVSTKLSLILKKKDECLKATRNLGVLPQDAYEKYKDTSMKELYFKMDQCNKDLQKLSHVNKKAMDQYLQFSDHKEKLIQRRDEAARGYKSILEFIQTLDQRKNENMQMTFKQVSKHFNEIFLKIVPQGTAHLVMRTNDNFEEEDRQRRVILSVHFFQTIPDDKYERILFVFSERLRFWCRGVNHFSKISLEASLNFEIRNSFSLLNLKKNLEIPNRSKYPKTPPSNAGILFVMVSSSKFARNLTILCQLRMFAILRIICIFLELSPSI